MHGRIFRSFPIGPFTIIPEGETSTSGIPVILGRKGAFGSGEHETTVACLEELSMLAGISGATVLDLGSGTGILAIAAARLGASRVVALDNDLQATVSCADNVSLNDLDGRVVSICGELACLTDDSFDLVLANGYADMLLALAADMVSITRPGGTLILSGIPIQDKFEVKQAFERRGCILSDSRIGEEYVTYVMEQRGITSESNN
ncbi:MAG: SAM-dependent methyltransferase [Geobacteraceae bacterium GWC2_55_20]|nr:MAG: SAM-dependent methyltransferase [Geobacteraceae bacterium GWC2_55_20]HCE67209.1 SAM-dependent methyltransferase [Geobacter sp.]